MTVRTGKWCSVEIGCNAYAASTRVVTPMVLLERVRRFHEELNKARFAINFDVGMMLDFSVLAYRRPTDPTAFKIGAVELCSLSIEELKRKCLTAATAPMMGQGPPWESLVYTWFDFGGEPTDEQTTVSEEDIARVAEDLRRIRELVS